MIIAARIKQLLDTYRIVYRVLPHKRIDSLSQAVKFLALDATQVFTTQVLHDEQGMLLVVFPSSSKIDFVKLNRASQRNLKLLAEISVNRIFIDCEAGCWPPVGQAYGLEVIIDKSIKQHTEIFFCAGTYTSMLKMRTTDFLFLNTRAKILDIALPVTEIAATNPATSKVFNNLRFPEFSNVVLSSKQAADQNLEFWQHAFYAAEYARNITTQASITLGLDPELSYMAGIYHNFGMYLFSQMFRPEYRMLQKWLRQDPHASIEILEQRLLGMGQAFEVLRRGHALLGEKLLRHWAMPESICVIAREHHNRDYDGSYASYNTIIQIANQLLRLQGIGDGDSAELDSIALSRLGLSQQAVIDAVQDIHLDAGNVMQMAQALSKV